MPRTQIGFHRTNDKTIQFFGQQGDTSPLGLNALVTVEGLDNFRESYTTGLGVVVSRRVGQGVALYAHPLWVANANLVPQVPADDDNTFLVGLGARVRLRPTVYVVGEFIPRVAGYDPGAHHVSRSESRNVPAVTCSRSTSRTRWERRSDSLRAEVRRTTTGSSGLTSAESSSRYRASGRASGHPGSSRTHRRCPTSGVRRADRPA